MVAPQAALSLLKPVLFSDHGIRQAPFFFIDSFVLCQNSISFYFLLNNHWMQDVAIKRTDLRKAFRKM